jgi:hypothetical protein
MAGALNQLIAQARGPDIMGSALQGLQAAGQEKRMAQDMDLRQQQITMGQRQLANADTATAKAHQEESLKLAADVAYRISKEQDPARKAELYMSGLQLANDTGLDTKLWPKQYDAQTQAGLDNIFAKVYGGEQVKTDEGIRRDAAKSTGPASNVGKLIADRKAAADSGAAPEVLAAYDAAIEKAGKSSGPMVNVTIGNKPPLTKANTSKVQDKVLDAEASLSDLSSIADKYSADFLTYKGRAKAMAGSMADKIGLDDKTSKELVDFNAERTGFRNSINQFFNQYRKEITGAAASEKEMQFLMESMFNQNLGPEEFKAAYSQFVDKAKKNYDINKRALREGVSVAPRTNDQGWELMIDSEGNQAYVDPENPDNYEEVE